MARYSESEAQAKLVVTVIALTGLGIAKVVHMGFFEEKGTADVKLQNLRDPSQPMSLVYKYKDGLFSDNWEPSGTPGFLKMVLPNGVTVYRNNDTVISSTVHKGKDLPENVNDFTHPIDQIDIPAKEKELGFLNSKGVAGIILRNQDGELETFYIQRSHTTSSGSGKNRTTTTHEHVKFKDGKVEVNLYQKINGEGFLSGNTQMTFSTSEVAEVVYFTGNSNMISSPNYLHEALIGRRRRRNSGIPTPSQRAQSGRRKEEDIQIEAER
jgi:hypothetical protein